MDTVLYLASLATRPAVATSRHIWPFLHHLAAGVMVLVSFFLLVHAICGA
ncbi:MULTISPECIES: hypothetical protein [Rhizobium]|uniref:Uncharacterized protein n=1 Tax=Rhizobium miluonense TaxID=411945 RepID=A0A1C3X4U8_9HYPH|nr:hypothetical protein [Rhizobium miluonense]SCB47146.1 hypothetical protein GA0061102_105723 [Rhizobium miluonense]